MARPLRLEHAGAVWHVTSRSNERKELFRDQAVAPDDPLRHYGAVSRGTYSRIW